MEEEARNLSIIEREVLETIASYANYYDSVYPSQKKIAERVDISPRHCNRILKKLKSKGFLIITYRHRNTCVYELPQALFIDGIKHILMKFIPSLRYMPIFLSLSLLYSNYVIPVNLTVLKGINKAVISRYRSMEKFIPKHIRDISLIELTIAGMVKLSAYPKEAVEWGEEQLFYKNNVKDPYGLLFKLLQDYCRREGLEPDWALVDSLKLRLGITGAEERTVTGRLYKERYLKKHHPEKAFNDSQVPSKHPVVGRKEVSTPRSVVTPPDVLESNRRKKEREAMSSRQIEPSIKQWIWTLLIQWHGR